jgi:anti-anti-sigma factor
MTIMLDVADAEGGDALRDKFARLGPGPLVIDLSRVPYLNSASLRELLRLRHRMKGEPIVLRDARPLTLRVLRAVNFNRLFEIETLS